MLWEFLIFLAVHFLVYLLVGRRLWWLRREAGIFLYHVVPAFGAGGIALALFLIEPCAETMGEAAIVVSVQGIYSLSFLELWSLTQGGYSLTILKKVKDSGGVASNRDLASLEQVGAGKQTERLQGLKKLHLLQSQQDQVAITPLGSVAAFVFRSLVLLVNHRSIG